MLIEQTPRTQKPDDENKDKARTYVWCNISTAVKQSFVAHQFRFYDGSAYNLTQPFEYQVDRPLSEEL